MRVGARKIGRVVFHKGMKKRIGGFFFFSSCRYLLTFFFFILMTLGPYIMHKPHFLEKKTANTFVRLVMANDLVKFCFTTLKNKPA